MVSLVVPWFSSLDKNTMNAYNQRTEHFSFFTFLTENVDGVIDIKDDPDKYKYTILFRTEEDRTMFILRYS